MECNNEEAIKARDTAEKMMKPGDVHCSEGWYDIFQVEKVANDALMITQFCKFALLLHPAKIKFHGAAVDFKRIHEAKLFFLDKEKRTEYDDKGRTPSGSSEVPVQNTSCQPGIRMHPCTPNYFHVTSEFMNQQGTQSEFPSGAGKEFNSNGNSENAYGKLNEGLSGE
uniref:Uncharacterized protein LOC104216877 isoform X1 n=1 Tax=Nicotiana sylvestris TaxID=4096 RepID=A0A1U7VG32_NICSY|nr:PREDICTED: uncharacterized protein LOC104216877 isoform X1 [Nicotiana sylvestris]